MKIHYFVVIVVLIRTAWCSSTDVCASLRNCKCGVTNSNGQDIDCPSSNENDPIEITFMLNNFVNLRCKNNNNLVLDNMNINPRKITLTKCNLTNFKNILMKFNTTALEEFKLDDCILGNSPSSQIDANFFEGFTSTKRASFASTLKTFKENVFENFPELLYLDLQGNDLIEIGNIFYNNPKLTVLQLSRNSLKNLRPKIFENLHDLKELYFWKNQLTHISQNSFTGLRNLKVLHFRDNCITHIDNDTFSELTELRNLFLNSNKLGHISSKIFKNNYKLEEVKIENNSNLTTTDYLFANLSNLKVVRMQQCHLKSIPEHTFDNCTNLIDLNLSDNELDILNETLFKTLIKLNTLNLSHNKLSFLPDNVFLSLENLQYLYLEGNKLTAINELTFKGLNNLTHLVLKNNQISRIHPLGFYDQKNLTHLDLSYNHWKQERNEFDHLEKLKQLLLNHNKETRFHSDLINTVYLEELDLSHNELKKLRVKDLILLMRNLKHVRINLTKNRIESIDFENVPNATVDGTVFVSDNPLHCGYDNFKFIQYLNNELEPPLPKSISIEIGDTKCDQKDKLIKDMLPEQVRSEPPRGKLPDGHVCLVCRCFIRGYDNAYIIDCSFGNLTKWPNITGDIMFLEINMTKNLLVTGPPQNMGYDKVKNLFLSHNKLKTFNWCPPDIENLELNHNNLQILDSKVLKILESSENFTKISLGNNPWKCDCSAYSLRRFIMNPKNKVVGKVLCENDNIPLVDKSEKDICKPILLIIVIPILGFFLITAIGTTLYFRYKEDILIWLFHKKWCRWLVTEEDLDKEKQYDIFLSFSHKDEEFIAKNLVPTLERSFKLCIHSRDWIPGELINDQIVNSVYNSRRTLVVLSNNYFESSWGRLEFLMAHKQSLDERRPRVIVIKFGELNADQMTDDFKAYIKTNTYIEWGETRFWERLMYALPHLTKNFSRVNKKLTHKLKLDGETKIASTDRNTSAEISEQFYSRDTS